MIPTSNCLATSTLCIDSLVIHVRCLDVQNITRLLKMVMINGRGQTVAQTVQRLDFMNETRGVFYDRNGLVCVSLSDHPMIVDLRWVASTLGLNGRVVDISDGSLAPMAEYLRSSMTVEGG